MRPRDPANAWMPQNVSLKKGRYVYVLSRQPYREVTIAPGGASRSEVILAAEALTHTATGTLRHLVDQYLESEAFRRLATKTKEGYRAGLDQICNWQMPTLQRPFGSLYVSQIGNKTIQRAYDLQHDPDSKGVARNRRFTHLSIVFAWGIQHYAGCDKNPVTGLRYAPERARTRYPTDAEYAAVYNAAPEQLQLVMEAIYLMRLRPGEAVSIHKRKPLGEPVHSFATDAGIQVIRGKGSRPGLVTWSPRLQAWHDIAQRRAGQFSTPWLIPNSKGQRIQKNAWHQALRRAIIRSGVDPFTLHDLKAKAITDGDVKDTHKSAKMLDVYDRAMRQEPPTR